MDHLIKHNLDQTAEKAGLFPISILPQIIISLKLSF